MLLYYKKKKKNSTTFYREFSSFIRLVYLKCGAQVISHETVSNSKIQSKDVCHLKSLVLFAIRIPENKYREHKNRIRNSKIVLVFWLFFIVCTLAKHLKWSNDKINGALLLLQIKGASTNKSQGSGIYERNCRKIVLWNWISARKELQLDFNFMKLKE